MPPYRVESAQRGHTAARYYRDCVELIEALSTEVRYYNTPAVFVPHCIASRACLRAAVISHWIEAKFIDEDSDGPNSELYGLFAGNSERCVRILNDAVIDIKTYVEQQFGHTTETPYDDYVRALREVREGAAARARSLARENDEVYCKPVPPQADIDESVRLEGQDMVSLKGLDPEQIANPHLKRILKGEDNDFSCIISVAASRAWVRCRGRFTQELSQCVKSLSQCSSEMHKFIDKNPAYLVLYFVAHSLGISGRTLRPIDTPAGQQLVSMRAGSRWATFLENLSEADKRCGKLVPSIDNLEKAGQSIRAAESSERLRERATAVATLARLAVRGHLQDTSTTWDIVASAVTAWIVRTGVNEEATLARILSPFDKQLANISRIVDSTAFSALASANPAAPKPVAPRDDILQAPPPSKQQASMIGMVTSFLGSSGSASPGPTPFSSLPQDSQIVLLAKRVVGIVDGLSREVGDCYEVLVKEIEGKLAEFDTELNSTEIADFAIETWCEGRIKWLRDQSQKSYDIWEKLRSRIQDVDHIDGLGEEKIYTEFVHLGFNEHTKEELSALSSRVAIAINGPLYFREVRAACLLRMALAQRGREDAEACAGQCEDLANTIRISRERELKNAEERRAAAAASSGRARGSVSRQSAYREEQPPPQQIQQEFTGRLHVIELDGRPTLPPLIQPSNGGRGKRD